MPDGADETQGRSRPPAGVKLTQTVELGRYRGYPVAAGPSRTPTDAPAPDEFDLDVFVPDENGANVDIGRIDTDHDGCHVDRLYLPEDHPNRRDYGPTVHSPEAALEWLLSGDRLERMLQRYDETHGLPSTAESGLDDGAGGVPSGTRDP